MKVGDNAHTKRSILCSCIPSNPMWGQNWPVGLQIGRDRRRGGLLMTRWGRIKLPGGAHAARGPQASGPCSRGVIQGTLHTCKKTKIKPTSRRIAKAHIAWHVLISLKKKAPGISNLRHFQCRNVLRTCLKRRSFSNTYFREAINCKARCLAVDCCKADCRGLVMSVLVHTYM